MELYNRNDHTANEGDSVLGGMVSQTDFMQETEEVRAAVYQKAKEQGKVTRKEVEQEFGFGSTKAYNILKTLCKAGLLIQQKSGNRTVYLPL